MVYKFVVISDIHWGSMDSSQMYKNLELFLEFINQMKDNIDFVVIAGDYFDYRLQLNSKTALLAIEWFDRFIDVCKSSNVKKVRLFKGTREHDNDQLEVFRPSYESDDGYFKIINTTTSEYLFPDLKCVYCPDENMNLKNYHQEYFGEFIPNPDIGFFHGNFDSILPDIEFNRIQRNELPTMIYEYGKFSRLIKGPMISGHWHVKNDYKSLYYVGSYDRWKFGEEEDKGFIYGEYNTEDSSYFIHRVVNQFARRYNTIMVMNEEVHSPSHFSELHSKISELFKEDPSQKLRIVYMVTTDIPESLINFNIFQRQYSTNSNVKIDLKDMIKREAKKEKTKKVNFESSKYQYIFNSDHKKIPEILHNFILDKKNVDIPLSVIEKYTKKYLEN